MLWIIVVVLLVLWLLGLLGGIGGQVVHVLLLGALLIVAFKMLGWRRRTR